MNDLVTTSDLENRLGITFSTAEKARAQALADMAAALVRSHAKQHITLVSNDTLTVPGIWSDRILLPERPVVDVSAVSATFYNGDPVTLSNFTWFVDRDELVRYPFPIGVQRHFFTTGNGWLGPGYKVTITYTHGYDPDASVVAPQLSLAKGIAAEMVARVWVNPEAASQSTIGGVQAIYPNVGMLLTPDEKTLLNDTFRRTSQTVTLR